jgi:hypothetical protein
MERVILQIRCGTLNAFLDRIENAPSESERTRITMEASKIADKILSLTPRSEFSDEEWDVVTECLEHYSLAVFCDHMKWARDSLDRVREIARPLF